MGKPEYASSSDLELGAPTRRRKAPPQYIDIDEIRDPEGIVAVMSQRLSNRAITFAVFKEFERDGRPERTSFIAASLRAPFRRVIDLVFERVAELETNAATMRKVQEAAIAKLDDDDDKTHARRVLGLDTRGGRR